MKEQDVKREQAMAKAAAKSKRRRRHIRWQFIAFVAVLLLAGVTALCLTVLFPVRTVTVKGDSRYTAKEITDVAAIEVDSNIILLDGERATGRVLEQLPFIGNCTLEKKLDGTVTLTVSELPGVHAYQSGSQYYIVNEKNKVIETVDAQPEDICIIVGAESETAEEGQSYTPKETAKTDVLGKLMESIAANALDVTRIDVSEEGNLRFVVENRILVEFGGMANFEYKMAHLTTTLKSMSSTDEGTLDLTWWTTSKKDAYFRRGNILTAIYGEDYIPPESQTDTEETSSESDVEQTDDAFADEYVDEYDDEWTDETTENYTEDTEYTEAEDEEFAEE